MDPVRYRRVIELFQRLRSAPPHEQEAALEGVDPDIGAQVRAMLDADLATGPLDHPSALPGAGGPWRGEIPQRLGSYRVIGELGRGAMGIVLEAERDTLGKRAALKVQRLAQATDSMRRRFEHEARILARLRHTGIAQVFDAGVEETAAGAVAWFALELVPGARSITAYCRHEELPLRDRIALFARVCDAVDYAHRNRVIHRDLKPANVLVDDEGAPKVIDFGIARVIDPAATVLTMQIAPGSLLGTAAYMSPEQWDGRLHDVDARTDVYSLGMILYELLTGRPALDLRDLSIAEAMQVAQRAQPPDPGAIEPRLRGNLSAIILKAMARDRERRYPWAASLADDLRHHLAGRPISARPPGPWQRMAAWIGRRPVATTAAASLAAAGLILGATFVSASLLARRPVQIVLDEQQENAWLVSMAGHRVHVWEDEPGGITDAQLVDRPAAMGGGRVAIITRSASSRHPELAGHVAIYDVSSLQAPIWSTRQAPLTPPPGYEDRIEIKLDAGETLLENVFQGVAGRQIVTAQGLWPYSPVSIRIFDLAGSELYAVWHDGGVTDMQWLPDRGQLVVTGMASEARWDQRGFSWPGVAYPYVVLALEPQLGHLGAPWTIAQDRLQDPTVRWCKWLGPADRLSALGAFELQLGSPTRPTAEHLLVATAHLRRDDARDPELMLGVDADGIEIRRWTSDAYKAGLLAGELPDPDSLRLLDITELPPRLDSTAARAGAP